MQVKILFWLTIALDAVADEADVARAEVSANRSHLLFDSLEFA